MKKNPFKIFSITVFAIAMLMMLIITVPLIKSYNNPDAFRAYIEGFGAWGFLMMMFMQISQIIVAIIPGEVVEFVAGTMYGWLGGWFFCSIGILIGQFLIFKAVKFFGKSLVEKVAGNEKLNKFKFLNDEKKLKSVIFILFFIPGTPKDLITYIVPLTKIKLMDFLVITFFARIPSVISSTYAGDAFSDKNFIKLLIVYVAIAAFSVIGALAYRTWEAKHEAKSKEKEES